MMLANALALGAVRVGSDASLPTMQDIFANDLLLAVEPWFRPDLTTEVGGYISQITDSQAGVVFSQGLGSAMPSSTMGARKIPRGDGIDDNLTTTTMGWAKGTNYSNFGFGGCWLDPAVDTTLHCLFAIGNAAANTNLIQRRAPGGANVLVGSVSNINSNPNLPDAEIGTGGFHWWMDIRTADADLYVNGTFVATLTVAVALTLSRSRLFASSANTAGQFGKLSLGAAYVANLATPTQRNAAMAVLAAAAAQITS